jgi:hypothetical protein
MEASEHEPQPRLESAAKSWPRPALGATVAVGQPAPGEKRSVTMPPGFRADFDGWLRGSAGPVNISQVTISAIADPVAVAQVVRELGEDDVAYVRLLGVIEVMNEVLKDKKTLPENFAEVLKAVREKLKEIAMNFGAVSYELSVTATFPPAITVRMTFLGKTP